MSQCERGIHRIPVGAESCLCGRSRLAAPVERSEDPTDAERVYVRVEAGYLAELEEDADLLDTLEDEALVRQVGVSSQKVNNDSLLANDGHTVTWHPLAQGLPVNMRYTFTVREALKLIREKRQMQRSGYGDRNG